MEYEAPVHEQQEVIIVDATENDEAAQLSQPLIVKDAAAPPEPVQQNEGGADPNAAAVTNQ